MTPLEARRMFFKDKELDKSEIPVKFARAVSRESMQKISSQKFKENENVHDSMRRNSSFLKKRWESVSNLIKKKG